MNWEIVAMVSVPILVAFLTKWLMGIGKPKWKRLSSRSVPMWIVSRVYSEGFPDKFHFIQKTKFPLRGSNYEYLVEVKDSTIKEPWANVGHLKVYQKKQGKE